MNDRHYSIDIAFPDIKLGIEINGNQHYDRKGNLLPYYQERHDLITQAGWKLIELHYSIAWKLDKIFDILENNQIMPNILPKREQELIE